VEISPTFRRDQELHHGAGQWERILQRHGSWPWRLELPVWVGDAFGFWSKSSVWTVSLLRVAMEAGLSEPADNTPVMQDYTFRVNATVFCMGGDCGEVMAVLLYNKTGAYPDTRLTNSAMTHFT